MGRALGWSYTRARAWPMLATQIRIAVVSALAVTGRVVQR